MTKFIFATDLHVGFENRNKHKVPLHDEKAINAMLKFATDFKPDVVIAGGDHLDCGPVSHWLKNSKRASAGLDLGYDIEVYRKLFLDVVNKEIAPKKKVWMVGNHEDWINDAIEVNPGLESVLNLNNLLGLKADKWDFKNQGEHYNIGPHLYFIHGDTLPGVKGLAAGAVERYGKSIVFGHFHTYQTFVKHSMLSSELPIMGVATPSLCKKNPNYLEGRPNQWVSGFTYGYVDKNGQFTLYTPIIIKGQCVIEGKKYVG